MCNDLDQYRAAFLDEGAIVNFITTNLEEKPAKWVVAFHDEAVPELENVDAFLEELQVRFGDPTQACWAESRIHSIRQGS